MRFVDEYRDPELAATLLRRIEREATRRWVVMEVCGGQTHSLVRSGIDRLLAERVELVHGPGCPVCVTPLESIDKAHAIAMLPGVIFTSFGDMLRVPGTNGDLLGCRARGADVRIVYSPLDALRIAAAHPDRQVVFFGVGFETTAPANAMALLQARRRGIRNFSMLVSHALTPPAIASILQAPGNRVQAFLGPGHVTAIVGTRPFAALCERYRTPIVVAGFEPVDLLHGILLAVRQLEAGEARVENAYGRSVDPEGSLSARQAIEEVFEVTDRPWRGVGILPKSGYRIRWEYRDLDAERRFEVTPLESREPAECIAGQVLRGRKKPTECPAFGTRCTPQTPLGATMVSGEGACAAHYHYGGREARAAGGAAP